MPKILIYYKLLSKFILSFDSKRNELQSNNEIFIALGSSLVFVCKEQPAIQIIQAIVNFFSALSQC